MRKLNILFFLVVSIFSFSQSKNTSSAEKKLEIPFQYVNNLLIVDLKVNGVAEKFVFDTGAVDLLTKNFATKLNLNLKRKGSLGGYFGKTDAFETIVTLVEIANKTVTNHPFRVADLKFVDDLKVAGLISEGFIRSLGYDAYTINYKNRKLILGSLKPNDFDFSFNIRERGYPRIEIGKRNFIIDTGNPLFGEFKEQEFVNPSGCRKISINSLSITNTKLDLCQTSLQDLQVKPLELKSFKNERSVNIIGNLSLQNYLIHMDRKNNKVYLKKNEAFPIPNDLYFVKGNDGFFVAVIDENSEAYKKGLRQGDVLLTIGERQISEFQNSEQLHNHLLSHTMNLNFKRGNQILQIDNLKID